MAGVKDLIEKLKSDVRDNFEQIRETINIREKLLLRQIDVIASHTNSSLTIAIPRGSSSSSPILSSSSASLLLNHHSGENISFIPERKDELLSIIRTFGKFNFADNLNYFASDLYANEDYILPCDDHETMYKCVPQKILIENITQKDKDINRKTTNNEEKEQNLSIITNPENLATAATNPTYPNLNENGICYNEDEYNEEKIVVDFSTNKKLIKENANNINESIVSITLNEAKDLIDKSSMKPATSHDELLHSNSPSRNIVIASEKHNPLVGCTQGSKSLCVMDRKELMSQSSQTDRKKRIHANITINNCNGKINMKNISHLTINCVNQDSMSGVIPMAMKNGDTDTTNSNSNNNHDNNKEISIDEIIPEEIPYLNDNSGLSSSSENNISFSSSSLTEKNGTISSSSASRAASADITSSSSSSATITTTKDNEKNSVNCEFYNRLIKEIKNTLKHGHGPPIVETIPLGYRESSSEISNEIYSNNNNNNNNNNSSFETIEDTTNTTTTATTTGTSVNHRDVCNRRYFLKNFENLKIILENNEDETRPVQIEQWLTEIISETEIEPMQNNEILEHSRIHNEELY